MRRNILSSFLFLFFKDFIYLFLERGEGKERERERNISVLLPLICSLLGTCPTTQACAMTGSQTSDPLVHRFTLNPLSYTSQGLSCFLIGTSIRNVLSNLNIQRVLQRTFSNERKLFLCKRMISVVLKETKIDINLRYA